MRRADRQISDLQKQRRNHGKLLRNAKHKLDRAIKRRDAARERAETAHLKLMDLRFSLARKTRVHPNPQGSQTVDKPGLRKRVSELGLRSRKLERKEREIEKKVDKVRALKQSRLHKPSKARITARKAERERAEDALGSAIVQMLSLSKQRAGSFGPASAEGFRKPVMGNITQSYGCTGYGANPAKGSCRHFHDGVDIAAASGRKVRASADGYVAYVGYSPWDTGARAFVVIIGHSNSYETVYAHLRPTRKVRAGERVRRGDVIGTVGMTGLTTGPHVHWEVKKGGAAVDPLQAGR